MGSPSTACASLSPPSPPERPQRITLFTAPFSALYEFIFVLHDWAYSAISYLLSHRIAMVALTTFIATYIGLKIVDGPGIDSVEYFFTLAIWWITLGILSSVGLGTGLHTFVLYLGPYIAKVTMAAEECRSLNFSTTGPSAFICNQEPILNGKTPTTVEIMHKVQLVCFLWGLGTALGELPPYFMARAAARSGRTLAALSPSSDSPKGAAKLVDRLKEKLFNVLQRFGFWAILVFASVPNPLFDLAGVTCGHFGVPFWTFFGATAIGKAVFKVALQSTTVIFMFHEAHLESLISTVERFLPLNLCESIHTFFKQSKAQFHRGSGSAVPGAPRPMIAIIWDGLLILMLAWFLRSIIDAAVHERMEKKQRKLKKAE
uniref:VTT domain-containing protein n=1 Tax=Spongospora subterranea TaxID=70186 RepID=A0A0H5RA99_9EUKA|eukprot:CRZ10597.1 hypothetical protein [Spongospora subterranea]